MIVIVAGTKNLFVHFKVVTGHMKSEAYVRENEATKKKLANLQDDVGRMIQRL